MIGKADDYIGLREVKRIESLGAMPDSFNKYILFGQFVHQPIVVNENLAQSE